MFYIYRFHKAHRSYLIWQEFHPRHRFVSTASAEHYLKHLGFSLMEICRDFCFRFISGLRRPILVEPKSWLLYPELRRGKGVKFYAR